MKKCKSTYSAKKSKSKSTYSAKRPKSTSSANKKAPKSIGKIQPKAKGFRKKRRKKKRKPKSKSRNAKKPKSKVSLYKKSPDKPPPPPPPPAPGPDYVQPADLPVEEITRVFTIPNEKFETFDDVVQSFGYELGKRLDAGSFGTIYIANDTKNDRKVACKVMDLGSNTNGIEEVWLKMMMCIRGETYVEKADHSAQLADTKNELYILEKVRHPYVIRVFNHFLVECDKQNRMYLFMELADGGNFAKFMEKRGKLPEKTSKLYYAQILCGIAHMHALGIAHRDIKLQNVLMLANKESISGDYILLVADFGLSYVVQRFETGEIKLNKTCCGTPAFMSPELLLEKAYDSFLADMWALGITLYLMLTLELPFDFRLLTSNLVDQMKNRDWSYGQRLVDEDGNEGVEPTADLQTVTKGMLEPVPRKRMSLKQLTDHRWITKEMQAAEDFASSYKPK